MSDDTPTRRMPEAPDAAGELVEERQKSKALLYTLIGVGAALLIAIVVLLIILFGGGDKATPGSTPTASDTPTTSPTPSDSPTPTESATPPPTPTPTPTAAPPPPPDTSPGFASFSQGQTVSCNQENPPGYTPPGISFSYTAKNASSVWFLFGEGDAADAQAFPMPISGNQGDVYGGGQKIEYPCGAETAKFTLTVVGNNGQHVNRTFTVTNTGDTY
jgi:hypothetical protein